MPDHLYSTTDHDSATRYIGFDCPVCEVHLEVEASPSAFECTCPSCGSLVMTPAEGIGPGTRLDDFFLIRQLGRGAMGEVYLAEQRSLSREVAVKILSPAWTSTTEQVTRFRHEVRTLARLQHPNIVTAFYAGQAHGLLYLAMHYVRGGTLHDRVRDKGPMSEEESLSVVYKVADALRHAWNEHGLIHRDIKPANIMIDHDGEIQLTDLGISKYVYEDASATHGHRVFGTPHYMSPEQARGELRLDFRTDQYSLGVTLYHLLAGRPPFDASQVNEVMRLQCETSPVSIRTVRPELSGACVRCLERLMAKRKEDRFSSWEELMATVSAALEAPSTRSVLIEPSRPSGRRRGRRIGWVFALLIAIAGATYVYRTTQDPSDRRPLPPRVQQIVDSARATPDVLAEAMAVLQEQIGRAGDAAEAARLRFGMQRLHRERDVRVKEVMNHLDHQAQPFIQAGQAKQAAEVYLRYDGPWSVESEAQRMERAEALDLSKPLSPARAAP